MKVALISDIHGNLLGLESVLQEIDAEDADQIICLGDALASGPQPHECLVRLRERAIPTILGNADAWLLDPVRAQDPSDFTLFIEELDLWCLDQLNSDDLAFMRTFQPTLIQPLSQDYKLLCFHGSPRSNTEVLLATTPDETLDSLLVDYDANIFAGGHTHQQLFRRHRDMILLNPGSIGLGYEQQRTGDAVMNVGRAEYALLEVVDGKVRIELRRVPFDVPTLIDVVMKSGMPRADEWVKHWPQG